MRYEYYSKLTLRGRRWRWRFVAANGEIIASGQSYRYLRDCLRAIDVLMHTHEAEIRNLDSGVSI